MDTRHKTITLPITAMLTIGGTVWGVATAWQKIHDRMEHTDGRFETIERKLSGMEPDIKDAYDTSHTNKIEFDNLKAQVNLLWRVRGRNNE
jgi:hypothetical protein